MNTIYMIYMSRAQLRMRVIWAYNQLNKEKFMKIQQKAREEKALRDKEEAEKE
jgi:hypothetical protein